MIIELNAKKIAALENIIKTHDFSTYLGFTSMHRGFEVPNLDNEIKLSVLTKLSTENWREVPSFISFWKWFKTKHGTHMAKQISRHMFPKDEKFRTYMVNCMKNKISHDWWDHIKARVYKKWCSILTEMQAVYAVVYGSEKLSLNWHVLASAQLDAMGVDFVIIANGKAIPIQVKKDSFHQQIHHKQNNKENFSRFDMTKKALKLIQAELDKVKMGSVEIDKGLLLKYGLPKSGKMAYDYLGHFPNGFVYFDRIRLVQELELVINTADEQVEFNFILPSISVPQVITTH